MDMRKIIYTVVFRALEVCIQQNRFSIKINIDWIFTNPNFSIMVLAVHIKLFIIHSSIINNILNDVAILRRNIPPLAI